MLFYKLCLLFFFFLSTFNSYASAVDPVTDKATFHYYHERPKVYEGIILGKVIKKKPVKVQGTYITEYKVKVAKWIYKKEETPNSKFIILKILGAELPEKGIVIKASFAPDYIPFKEDAVFFLEKTKVKEKKKNIFTLSQKGVIFGDNLEKEVNLIEGLLGKTGAATNEKQNLFIHRSDF